MNENSETHQPQEFRDSRGDLESGKSTHQLASQSPPSPSDLATNIWITATAMLRAPCWIKGHTTAGDLNVFLQTFITPNRLCSSSLLCLARLFCIVVLDLRAEILRDNAQTHVWNAAAYHPTNSHSHIARGRDSQNACGALWPLMSNVLSL